MKCFIIALIVLCCAKYGQSCMPTVPTNGRPPRRPFYRGRSEVLRNFAQDINKGLEKHLEKHGDILCKVSNLTMHNFEMQVRLRE